MPSKPPILPGYTYNGNTSRYRDLTTGRFVGRHNIVSLLEQHVNAKEELLSRLTNDLTAGKISPATYVAQTRQELLTLHLQNAAIGSGGFDRLTPTDYGRIGGTVRDEYRRMAAMAQGVADGTVSEAQALNRLHMYVGNARSQFYAAERDRVAPSSPDMILLGRRVLGTAEHCDDCVTYANHGWQPIENVAIIGDSQCDGNCRCSTEQREVLAEEADQWIGSKR